MNFSHEILNTKEEKEQHLCCQKKEKSTRICPMNSIYLAQKFQEYVSSFEFENNEPDLLSLSFGNSAFALLLFLSCSSRDG